MRFDYRLAVALFAAGALVASCGAEGTSKGSTSGGDGAVTGGDIPGSSGQDVVQPTPDTAAPGEEVTDETPDTQAEPGDLVCQPQCDGKECGPNGCGGTCGTCPQMETCTPEGTCKVECVKNCAGKECGDDGCGGSCGACTGGKTCTPAGVCAGGTCTPKCDGKECGSDSCGGTCGSCTGALVCSNGKCVKSGECELPDTLSDQGAHMNDMYLPKSAAEFFCDANGDGSVDGDDGLLNTEVLGLIGMMGIDPDAEIQKALEKGDLVLLFELAGYTGGDAGDILTNLLVGRQVDDQPDPTCNDMPGGGSNCDWLVDPATFDPATCLPFASFPSEVSGGELVAGPTDMVLPIDIGLGLIELPLTGATVKGSIEGGSVNIADGRLCGTFPKDALMDALNAVCEGPDAPSYCSFIGLVPLFIKCDPCSIVVGFEAAEVKSLTVDKE